MIVFSILNLDLNLDCLLPSHDTKSVERLGHL